jgi:polyisoprenoid-binding protein YceI
MTTATKELIPSGTWVVDPVHSNASFEVEHGGLSVFRGGFKPVDAKLVGGERPQLEGAVSVESISIDDENLRPHLLSPDFFDVERNQEIRFRSTEIQPDGDGLRVAGELSMAGISANVESHGQLRGPVSGPGGADVLAIELEAAIDRTDFGMDWQMELPSGGDALANEVKLIVSLELRSE